MLIKNPDVRNRLGLLCMPRAPRQPVFIDSGEDSFALGATNHLPSDPTSSSADPFGECRRNGLGFNRKKNGKMPDAPAKIMLTIRKNQRKNIFRRLGLVEVGAWAVDVE